MPFGQLVDLINCYMIHKGIAQEDKPFNDEEAIPDWK